MMRQATVLLEEQSAAPADALAVVGRLGSFEPELDPAFATLAEVNTIPLLTQFLDRYQAELLIPIEFPAIVRAFHHAAASEYRELLVLDHQLSAEPRLTRFSTASQLIGRLLFSRLRPLRDHRFVQRYLDAMDTGRAFGWHTLAYGITLAVFSIPLRQGLATYGANTLDRFAAAAVQAHHLPALECRLTLANLSAARVEAINRLLNARLQLT